ncbi:acetyl-CoA hydrolase/transferase family protein [Alcaligenaceae bacterium]|nr:acetyl-CoA hydrolase/transferase family protein [Alcaligenaceae bacterium]
MPVTEVSHLEQRISYADWLQADDLVLFGQGSSEPVGLVRELVNQADDWHERIGRLGLFMAGSYSGLLRPEHGKWFDFHSYGAFGDATAISRAGLLNVHPVTYSQLPALLTKKLKADVVLLQLSPPDARNRYSLGVANDYQLAAAREARVVIAEINQQAPYSPSALLPLDLRIDHMVWADEPLVEIPSSSVDEVSVRIASHVAQLIPDGGTIQMGMGSLMTAICDALSGHKDLGIHSGILNDGMAELIRRGVVTNARKGTHVGRSVVGSLLGTRRLFEFADNNRDICLVETSVTHGRDWLSRQTRLCAINSAIEIDLTGQVNAEVANGRYVGAIGGQPDFIRAAGECDDGVSIIALPSSAAGGRFSRIVDRLNGPVTTPRCDVDCVVTEWGVARLRGLALRQRAVAMAGIAHPKHRDSLLAAATRL